VNLFKENKGLFQMKCISWN